MVTVKFRPRETKTTKSGRPIHETNIIKLLVRIGPCCSNIARGHDWIQLQVWSWRKIMFSDQCGAFLKMSVTDLWMFCKKWFFRNKRRPKATTSGGKQWNVSTESLCFSQHLPALTTQIVSIFVKFKCLQWLFLDQKMAPLFQTFTCAFSVL